MAPAAYWLKTYSLSPFKEHWTLSIDVRNFERDLPKILAELASVGAAPSVPLENMAGSEKDKVQQLSYRLSLEAAKRGLKKLKKIGTVSAPVVRPEPDRPSLPEVKEKITRLIAAKKDRSTELGRVPDVSALVDELLEHLLLVEHIQEDRSSEVLLNMTVRQSLPTKR